MSIRPSFLPALLALSLVFGCAAEPEPPLAVRITWGLNGTSALPSDVAEIEVVTCTNAGQVNENCTATNCSVAAITGMTEQEVTSCRPRAGSEMYEMDPVLIRRNLPTDGPIRFRLHGLDSNGNIAYVGQLGPIVLAEGERRYVSIRMYDLGASVQIGSARIPRLLHTSTLLPDGRILVAGGFDTITALPACPPEVSAAAGARCFDMTATNEAIAFDVASGSITPIRNRMLAARGGHTATALPDGRVLIAGGAEAAILGMVPSGAGFVFTLATRTPEGTIGDAGLASLELFDAFLDEEAEDIDRDGDLGRGAFLGSGGMRSAPVPMNHARCLHAAATVPGNPSRVLLVGGIGSPESRISWEMFDNDRTGGYGVYAETGNRLPMPPMPVERVLPSAVGIGDRIWIFGGSVATGNEQLADIWTVNEPDPNGLVFPASTSSQFPNAMPAGAELHPEYSLARPAVAAIDGGQRALVVGWYGPQCEVGMTTPVYPSGTPTEVCTSPMAPTTRSFTVTDSPGLTIPTQARAHAFGGATETTCFRSTGTARYFVVTGGIANSTWGPQPAIDVFDGTIDGMGAAAQVEGVSASMAAPRFFHTSTGVPGLGVVSIGGASFNLGVDQLFFADAPEVLFIPSPSPTDC